MIKSWCHQCLHFSRPQHLSIFGHTIGPYLLPVVFNVTTEDVFHVRQLLTMVDAVQILVKAVLIHNSAINLSIFKMVSDDVLELHVNILFWTFAYPTVPGFNLTRQKSD